MIFSLNPSQSSADSLDTVSTGSINLNNLEELVEENLENISVKEMTFEEFLQDRATAKGISLEQAREMYPEPKDARDVDARSNKMHEIKIQQDVGAFYKPAIQIVVWGYFSGSIREFKYIQEVDLDRNGINNNYTSRQFTGKVQAKLTSAWEIWWFINGDFYKNGATSLTVTGGGEYATIGKTVTGTFSISKQLEHDFYFEDSGTYSAY